MPPPPLRSPVDQTRPSSPLLICAVAVTPEAQLHVLVGPQPVAGSLTHGPRAQTPQAWACETPRKRVNNAAARCTIGFIVVIGFSPAGSEQSHSARGLCGRCGSSDPSP